MPAKITHSSAVAAAAPASRGVSSRTVTRSARAPGTISPASGQPRQACPAAVAAPASAAAPNRPRRPEASRSSSSTRRASSSRVTGGRDVVRDGQHLLVPDVPAALSSALRPLLA